jgi:alpha-ribazole phosphatase/probable phosphoglycerate mutase
MTPGSSSTWIDLLRHGEPIGGRRYRGQIDDPLSDRGWQQMRDAVAGCRDWNAIYSSPLRRCAEFARDLADRLAVPLTLDDRLKEVGFGAWEGRTAEELRQDDPHCIERFRGDPVRHRPEGAEPLPVFQRRVTAAWQDLVAANAGRRVLLVGHAGITRLVMTLVLGSPLEHLYRIQVENAGLTRIRVQGRGAQAQATLQFHGRRSAAGP